MEYIFVHLFGAREGTYRSDNNFHSPKFNGNWMNRTSAPRHVKYLNYYVVFRVVWCPLHVHNKKKILQNCKRNVTGAVASSDSRLQRARTLTHGSHYLIFNLSRAHFSHKKLVLKCSRASERPMCPCYAHPKWVSDTCELYAICDTFDTNKKKKTKRRNKKFEKRARNIDGEERRPKYLERVRSLYCSLN